MEAKEPTKQEKTARAADLLREAAKSIETALVLLDTRSTRCAECRTTHWKDQLQARTYQQLTDTPHKLRTTAERLEVREITDRQQAAPSRANE